MQRMNYYRIAPEGTNLMIKFEEYAKTTAIAPGLRDLIKIRASQINGCAFCLNMHTQEARKAGESEQRIFCLSAWRECPFYTDAERVALELTEAVTRIAEHGVPNDLYNRVREHFNEKQYVDLIMLINLINSWNRLSISMGNVPSVAAQA